MIPYIPHTKSDREEMLEVIGVSSPAGLFKSIPGKIRLRKELSIPEGVSEPELEKHMRRLSSRNACGIEYASFLGAGCYRHFIPAVVDYLAGRSEFYTSYTPYQAEASQGILQAFFEYQSMISEICGLEVTNASMYDGATAAAEAALMGWNVNRRKKVVVSRTVHPEYRQVMTAYLKGLNIEVVEIDFLDGVTDLGRLKEEVDSKTSSVIVQNPNFFGCLEDVGAAAQVSRREGALFIVIFNPVSCAILKSPGECGADIAVSEARNLGGYPGFGGYGLGTFSCRREFIRKMPGRMVSQTVDREGKRGFVLALQTREQHIRRGKATSNICSNEALCSLRAAIYLAALGTGGLKQVANLCVLKSHLLHERISKINGFRPLFDSPFFHEFAAGSPLPAEKMKRKLLKSKIIGGYPLSASYPELGNSMLWCATEMNSDEEIEQLGEALEKMAGKN